MIVIETINEMQKEMLKRKKEGKTIGYVPTMGFLHEGHLELVRRCREENDICVVSIFVNPLQFGEGEDFDVYPRDFEKDREACLQAGVDYIFYPSVSEMYPEELSVTVKVQKRTDVLCGASRPGHFDGVATVLTKLFHIVLPDKAYFGMKDAQQVAVVEGLVSDFHFPIEIVPVETVREEDGLAKSSRNVNLTTEERKEAPYLYKSLLLAKEMIGQGERKAEAIESAMRQLIEKNTSGQIDYIEIYSFPQLEKQEQLEGKVIIALAVKFSKARLIDNLILEIDK